MNSIYRYIENEMCINTLNGMQLNLLRIIIIIFLPVIILGRFIVCVCQSTDYFNGAFWYDRQQYYFE